MPILVTGDTGFIGSHMKEFLMSKGEDVAGFSRRNGFNINNVNQLNKAVKDVEIVYHFAAEAKPGESVLNPKKTLKANIIGTLNVLEACRKHDKRCIYPSSCEIYGDSDTHIKETHPMRPTNPYASSKAALDRICYMYHRCYGLDVKIIRLFNPYGPKQQLNKAVTTFGLQVKRNEPLTVFGNGSDIRDYVYISDVVNGLWLANKAPSGEAINLATGIATSNFKLARLIRSLKNSTSEIRFVEYPEAFGGIKRQVGSWEKARDLLGWAPSVSIEEGVDLTLRWLDELSPEILSDYLGSE